MKIKEILHDNIAVLSVSGKMMSGPETQKLHEHVSELVAKDVINIVVDLSKVKWLNSTGLGTLMSCFTTLVKKGGALKLSGVTEGVKSLLMLTQLITFFEHFDTPEEAVVSFKESS